MAPTTHFIPVYRHPSGPADEGHKGPDTACIPHPGVRVLVDPWLEGDLTFAEQDWLYRGKKRVINASKGGRVDIDQIAEETDVVVLTQVGVCVCPGVIRPKCVTQM